MEIFKPHWNISHAREESKSLKEVEDWRKLGGTNGCGWQQLFCSFILWYLQLPSSCSFQILLSLSLRHQWSLLAFAYPGLCLSAQVVSMNCSLCTGQKEETTSMVGVVVVVVVVVGKNEQYHGRNMKAVSFPFHSFPPSSHSLLLYLRSFVLLLCFSQSQSTKLRPVSPPPCIPCAHQRFPNFYLWEFPGNL